jgi:hypothetical protein
MSKATRIAYILIDEGKKARAHFQVWWALRNKALPKYYKTMNDRAYVDFFHASNSGHCTLFMLSMAKIFDRDSRAGGIKAFKQALREEGLKKTVLKLNLALKPHLEDVKRVMAIRNKFVVHTEHDITPVQEGEIYGLTPNQWRALIDTTCHAINEVSRELEITTPIFVSDRAERATLNMLETLASGAEQSLPSRP